MTTFNGLPVYAVTLSAKRDGVVRVSLVDDPAVCSNFDVFAAQLEKRPALYAVQDEDRHIVRGVVLRAGYPIYRRDGDDDPGYYVTFSAEVIREIAEKYLADGRANAVDTYHDRNEVDGVQMVQFFIKDSAAGVDPEGFGDIADGSLFAEYHITNGQVWDEIKAGAFKGFSVEVFYTLVPAQEFSLLDRIFDKIQSNMSFEKFKARLAALLAEPETFGSVTTDKGVLHWDGDEDLKAGDRVEVEDAEGDRTPAPSGDYTTGDGKVIVVVDGAVSEIRDPEAEVAPENEPEESAELRRFKAVRAAFEQSYEDKERAIIEAIYAAREGDDDPWYLYEAGDDFAIIAIWNEETYEERYVRYDIAWNEDGTAAASNPQDVELAFVPEGSAESAEADFAAALGAAETFKAENATLKARIAELEARPAGKPAHESFRGEGPEGAPAGKTGNKGLDRLTALMNA